jgi:predicted permease
MRDFGGIDRFAEASRDERGTRRLDALRQDVSFAVRSLLRRPAFTAIAAITLALGIGATTALFGVFRTVLMTPLPYAQPEGLAMIWSAWTGFDQTWISYDEWEAWNTQIPAIDRVAIFGNGALTLNGGDEPVRIHAGFVQAGMFGVLGVEPELGRAFTAEEDRPGGPGVIVLGHDLWRQLFDGDPAIIGRPIQVNGVATTVVGVMPAGFELPLDFTSGQATVAWMPLGVDAESDGASVAGPEFNRNGQNHNYYAVARLAPGATASLANSQLSRYIAGLVEDGIYPAVLHFRAYAVPVEQQVTGRIRPALLVVFGAVGFVLLIACANVAGLLLVRGEQRRRELAIRVALGARAGRLTRLLLTESAILGAMGGIAGISLAWLAVWSVRHGAPAGLPRIAETKLDVSVLVFAMGVTIAATMLAGVLPALQASRVAPARELKEGGRGTTTGRTRLRWRRALVATEVALAVVLVIGAGLMIRSVANLLAIDSGFRAKGVLTLRLSTPATWYPDSVRVAGLYDRLQREVRTLPGVQAVGAARLLPLESEMGDRGLQVEGYTPPPNQGTPGDWQVVTPGYFEAMGMHLVSGRFLEDRDGLDGPFSMIVNRRFVAKYFAGRDALGGRVRIGNSPYQYTIVGIVDDVTHNSLTTEVKPQFYVTLAQFAVSPGNTRRTMSLVVRTSGDPLALARPVRDMIHRIDPRLPVSDVRTMEQVLNASIAEPRFVTKLLGLFGALALVLSAIGIFGIVSQMVASRSHEFGVRAALGASPGELAFLSLRSGLSQTVTGIAVGVVLALLLTRVLGSLLHDVAPSDPLTFVVVLLIISAVSIAASLAPARRSGPMADNIVVGACLVSSQYSCRGL